jgi:predicted transcriptional regulator
MNSVEMTQIDLRFERLRLRDPAQEKKLLSSIVEEGIREPLQCVVGRSDSCTILLDGFKRYRCARKASIRFLPVASLGEDETQGIVTFIRASNGPKLHALEEASLLTELKKQYGMGAREIATHIDRSPAWVSLRLGMLHEMSEVVRREIFSGRFPLRSYMYTLRPFTRVNTVTPKDVDQFVKATSAKGFSTRNLDLLAHAYFKGPKLLRAQIEEGNLDWTLKHLKDEEVAKETETRGASKQEQIVLSDLERAQKYMGKVTYELGVSRLKDPHLLTRGRALAKRILGQVAFFIQTLKTFYDSSGHTKSDSDAS